MGCICCWYSPEVGHTNRLIWPTINCRSLLSNTWDLQSIRSELRFKLGQGVSQDLGWCWPLDTRCGPPDTICGPPKTESEQFSSVGFHSVLPLLFLWWPRDPCRYWSDADVSRPGQKTRSFSRLHLDLILFDNSVLKGFEPTLFRNIKISFCGFFHCHCLSLPLLHTHARTRSHTLAHAHAHTEVQRSVWTHVGLLWFSLYWHSPLNSTQNICKEKQIQLHMYTLSFSR